MSLPSPSVNPPPLPSLWPSEDPVVLLAAFQKKIAALHAEVEKVVVGQRHSVDAILYALLSRGHCLLVGVPGLAKTLLVNALSRLLGLPFSRIQFTPDLMPSDVTGTEILEEDITSGHRKFVFAPGPIFTNVLLADEINRTPPKTQAALLEAMQEKTVTVAGKIRHLDEPFIVLATQNPIEQEGTYPLPEAQLDRFLFELLVDYPDFENEVRIVEQHSFTPTERLQALFSPIEIRTLRETVAQIPAAPNVVRYAVRLVRATRPDMSDAPDEIRKYLKWGASPRASQNLIVAGRARAACQGRFNVACEDVAALAPDILRHRLIRNFQADVDNVSSPDIIRILLEKIKP